MPRLETISTIVKRKGKPFNKIKEVIKYCPCCGLNMEEKIETKNSGRKDTYLVCISSLCNHKEIKETHLDRKIRFGVFDRNIGILKLNND